MKPLILLGIFLLLISIGNTEETGWATDYRKALKTAKAEQKPSLLFFTADWCHYCDIMKRTTLQNPQVLEEMKPYQQILIDFDREPFAVSKYGLRGIPAIVLLDGEGNVVATSTGMLKPEPLLAWMRRHADKISPELAKKARIQKSKIVKEINQDLAKEDLEDWRRGMEKLFDACVNHNEDVLGISREKLAAAVEFRPKASLEFLTDPRLMVRILIGNAFQNHLGETFSYDPWSSKEHWDVARKQWDGKLEE